ncbi:alpha/beta hydrolase [Agromyces archimandritae]|uniref:Alpha/beta hydrolase n=1 Tax=Agromyces archimandritae TaxID=2781962 RepID=A0A975IR60_9MICO|nr:alpha/beta hydrolase [Agromyces archimandritae]QTX05751.1 alpha/beta hydrolase [Agromyces archimandritae]
MHPTRQAGRSHPSGEGPRLLPRTPHGDAAPNSARTGRGERGIRTRRRTAFAAAGATLALAAVAALSGFHLPLATVDADGASGEVPAGARLGIRTFTTPDGLTVDADLEYGTQPDGTLLTLDVCRPEGGAATARAAVVAIHGGSWQRGAKDDPDWRRVCLWLASEGFVAAAVDYRLVPDAVFPAQIDDVSLAVEWMREHAADFGADPSRIGVLGGSAGGQLATLLGTRGEGATDAGSRVAAVVELSGPVGLREPELESDGASDWLRGIVDAYLGCEPEQRGADRAACTEARAEATPAGHADASDPPVFIGHATDEIIPLAQAERLARELREAGVVVELAVVQGGGHSIGILGEELRAKVAAFLHAHLAPVPASEAEATSAR